MPQKKAGKDQISVQQEDLTLRISFKPLHTLTPIERNDLGTKNPTARVTIKYLDSFKKEVVTIAVRSLILSPTRLQVINKSYIAEGVLRKVTDGRTYTVKFTNGKYQSEDDLKLELEQLYTMKIHDEDLPSFDTEGDARDESDE